MSSARELQLNMRLSGSELTRLDTLAAHYGITRSDVVRMLVKLDWDRIIKAGRGRR